MKRLTYIIISLLTLLSCSTFDHTEILEQLRDHEERIQELEALCIKLNSNIEAMQTLLAALEDNDYITDITRITEGGIEIGYAVTFARYGTISIFHGTNGEDGAAPKVSIRKAADGEYYWTSDGEWLTDEDGSMIPATVSEDADGEYITPEFRVAEGRWYVSYDNGNTWRPADAVGGDIFIDAAYDSEFLYVILADGTELKLPRSMDNREVDLFIFMGQSNMAGCGNAAEAPKVPEGWGYEYKAISDPGKLLHMVEPFGLNEDNPASGVVYSRRGSLVSAFTNAYYRQTETPVVGVSCSKGSTSTEFWMPGGAPLNDAIQRHRSAERWLVENGYTIRNNFMVWLQGERDASTGVTPEEYSSNLKSILRTMINHTGVEKCVIIRIGKFVGYSPTICDTIIQTQTELCQTYKEFILGSALAAGFVEDDLMNDPWHYTQEGYNILGEDVGINLAFYVNNRIEPYMYDPHTRSTYFPVNKYKSIFDEQGSEAEGNGASPYVFPMDLEYEVLRPVRQVTGYVTDCVTGMQEVSADDYYHEYDVDPSWSLYATGHAPAAHASNAAVTYLDAAGQLIGFEAVDFVSYNYRNLPLNLPAGTAKVQVASTAAGGKLVPVLKRAINLIDSSTRIDYDTALDEYGTATSRDGWAVAYDIPVESGREYYAPYASRAWCYDKSGNPAGSIDCEDGGTGQKAFCFKTPEDVNAIRLSYNLSGSEVIYPGVYTLIDEDAEGSRLRITEFSQNTGGFINVFTGEITVPSSSPIGKQCLNYYVIPEGATQVDYPCYKTSKVYGSGFLNAEGEWISGYSNVTPGVNRHTMDIPADAHTFVLGYPDNTYAAELNIPAFDYLEFISF
ncbi:MAG: hypothetical protein E7112_08720 [Bacteroidales bacterium]|nr:hypothetical protein [Bacteroidales bacterium]